MKFEKSPLYDEQGRVIDPAIAEKAAHIENKGHKKTLGIFEPGKRKIRLNKMAAERAIEEGDESGVFSNPENLLSEPAKAEIKRLRDELLSSKEERISVKYVIKADIGGSVERFRAIGWIVPKKATQDWLKYGRAGWRIEKAIGDGTWKTFNKSMASEMELIIDVKDGKVVRSEIKNIPGSLE